MKSEWVQKPFQSSLGSPLHGGGLCLFRLEELHFKGLASHRSQHTSHISPHFPTVNKTHSRGCIIFPGFFFFNKRQETQFFPQSWYWWEQSPLFLVHTCRKHLVKVNLSYFFNKAWVMPEKRLQDMATLLWEGYCSTGCCHCSRWGKSSYQWGRNQKPKRFQTASENKKYKGFICYLCIIFPFKFQVLLKKISYYVLNLWAELKRSWKQDMISPWP